ncbi:hypothetical protein FOL47_005379 [Perkinsus chesapeaki]|uniref:Cas1p 10 TM acyl transferase domain-containing protein n=1 Tax=Perkinsus chesapeaki TaxID=330153 RepID=A0A7J6N3T1_PERCH|nr:hypothetical protein FOL47_005379 [Perkinsus chesapeaki]
MLPGDGPVEPTLSNILPVTTLMSVLVFGSCALLCLSLHSDEIISNVLACTGSSRYQNVGSKPTGEVVNAITDIRAKPFDGSVNSWKQLTLRATQLGVILLWAFACEWAPFYPHGERRYARDTFWFIFIVFMLHSLTWVKIERNPEEAKLIVFGRKNSEELKGWLQFLFLAYHYFHASDIYNMIRVFVSAYVWMTGFGNFSYFYTQNDYSIGRLIAMLWRLNMSVILLCLTMNTTYILYYIVPLHTFYFLLAYFTMRTFRSSNYDKSLMRAKLVALGVIIYLIWDVDHRWFDAVFGWVLPHSPIQGAQAGVLYEWHYRSGLDHWSAYLGMVFAYTYPTIIKWMEIVEKLPQHHEWFIKLCVLSVLGFLSYSWFTEVHSLRKGDYNRAHPYFFAVPLLTFIFARNLTPWLRTHYLEPLVRMGKITLETYLLQHHIWLTENAKKTLVLLPDHPLCNLLITTSIYLYMANRLFRITVELRATLLPEQNGMVCLRHIGVTIAVFAVAGCLAVICALMNADKGQVAMLVLCLSIVLARLLTGDFSASGVVLSCGATITASVALAGLPWDVTGIMNYVTAQVMAMEPGLAACDRRRGLTVLGVATLMLLWYDPFLVTRPVTLIYTTMVSSTGSLREAYDYCKVYGPLHKKYGLPRIEAELSQMKDVEMRSTAREGRQHH